MDLGYTYWRAAVEVIRLPHISPGPLDCTVGDQRWERIWHGETKYVNRISSDRNFWGRTVS